MSIPTFYQYLHIKLLSHTNDGNLLPKDRAVSFLASYNVPMELRGLILKEFQTLGMIEEYGQYFKILHNRTKEIKQNEYSEKWKIKKFVQLVEA